VGVRSGAWSLGVDWARSLVLQIENVQMHIDVLCS